MLRDEQKKALSSMRDLLRTGEVPAVTHLPTDRRYFIISVVLREADLVPCAIYGTGDGVWWTRPLADILYGSNWEWEREANATFTALSRLLGKYGGE